MTWTLPVSRSTSTSQMCVPNPGPAPSVLSDEPAVDRAAGGARLGGDLRQRQRREIAGVGAGGTGLAVLPDDGLDIDLPDLGRALAQGLDHLLGRLRHHHGGGERDAAAAGQRGEADRAGVADQRLHLAVVDAEQFGGDVDHRGARAADVGVARHHHHGAVLVDVDLGAGFAAGIEPEAAGDAAALVGAQRRLVVRMARVPPRSVSS